MDFQRTSQTRIRAWLAVVVWSIAGLGFFLAFFSGGGVSDFDTDSRRHMLGAAAIGFGFVTYWAGLWFTRGKGGGVVADERDSQVVARASQVTLIIVLILVFLGCITLWTIHEPAGVLDVGWMWFLAYGSMLVGLVTNAAMVLVFDRSGVGRG